MAYSSIATGKPLTVDSLGFWKDYETAGGSWKDWQEVKTMFDPYQGWEREELKAGAKAETADLQSTWDLAGEQLGATWGLQKGQLKEASKLQLGQLEKTWEEKQQQLGETWQQKRGQLGETWGLKRGELGAGARSGLLQGGRAMSAIGRGGMAQSGQATEMGLGALRDIRQQYGRGMQAGRSSYEQAMSGGQLGYEQAITGGETAYQQALKKGEMGLFQRLATGQMGYEQKWALGQQKLGQQQAGIARGLRQDIYGTEQEWERAQRSLFDTILQKVEKEK